MFVPIYDDNPLKRIRFQYVTVAIIVVNVLVYALEQAGFEDSFVATLGLVPADLIMKFIPSGSAAQQALPVGFSAAFPEPFTLLTYMFLHGSWVHLIGNMIFLWVFGDNVEDAMGHIRFTVFYFACGVAGALLHAVMQPTSMAALIGASGAVAGVIAAYMMLHPRIRVWVLAFNILPLRISAAFALGSWILIQVAMVAVSQSGQVALWAHIGGFLAGAVLVCVMRSPGVPLFSQALPATHAPRLRTAIPLPPLQ